MLSRFSHVRHFATLWTVACQAPLSMGFSMQEYWSGLPCSPPRDLPNLRIKPESLMSPALTGRFFTTSATWDAQTIQKIIVKRKKYIYIYTHFPFTLSAFYFIPNFHARGITVPISSSPSQWYFLHT